MYLENVTLKVSEGNDDLVFDDNGILVTVEGSATTAQNVRMALTAWKGDFPLVEEHGTDYKRIFDENCMEDEREEVLREAILQEDNVKQIEKMQIVNNEKRNIAVSFAGVMKDGGKISMEVESAWKGKNGD